MEMTTVNEVCRDRPKDVPATDERRRVGAKPKNCRQALKRATSQLERVADRQNRKYRPRGVGSDNRPGPVRVGLIACHHY